MGDGKFEITQTKYRLTEEQKQEDGSKLSVFLPPQLQSSFVGTAESAELILWELYQVRFLCAMFEVVHLG
jgi:hypothetical protein